MDLSRTSAGIARANGWKVGTRLVGDEGYGPSTIEITAIGREHVLAVWNGGRESLTCLSAREWKVAPVRPDTYEGSRAR